VAVPALSTYSAATGQPIFGGRWPGGRLSGSAALGAVVAGGSLGAQVSQLSGSAALGAVVASGGLSVPVGAFEVVANGIHTWFTRPEVLQVGGFVYVGWVNSAGDCGATQIDLSNYSTKQFTLVSALEIDDHNNTSFVLLENGRIAAFYGSHNDAQFKYRVYNPAGDFASSASWTTAEQRGTGNGPYSYPNPIRFTQDSPRVWLFKRRWIDGGGGTRRLAYRTATNLTGTPPHTWSAFTDVYGVANRIPYWRTAHNGTNRVHFAITNGHPVEGQTSLYHFYGELDGSNVMKWYTSAGVEITASLPLGPSNITEVYDGSSVRCWVSDCTIDSDGRPRILWMRYPNNNGTAIEYWHSRWTGSAWVNHKITDDGAGLYPGEQYYHGGLAFDQQDASKIFLSAPISGVRQIQEWSTSDNGATWAKSRDITTGGSANNPLKARPIGVTGGDGRIRLVWWQGTYTSYVNYSTSMRASG
jgi:hypothetical protein